MMTRTLIGLSLVGAVLHAPQADARFGKRGGSSGSSGSSSSNRGSGNSGSTYHSAVPVGSPSASSYAASRGYSPGFGPVYRPYRAGYWSGAFVPMYGYGYSYWGPPPGTTIVSNESAIRPEPSGIRITVGLDGLYSLSTTNGAGYVVGLNALFEGERFGVSIVGQTIQTQMNQLSQLNAHLTYAFLAGRYGRLRVELGADTFFAEDLIVLAPTGGFSGQVWIAGPVALEGSIFATPWPIWQLDGRAGVVLGIDSIGIRAGFRAQILEDRGIVPGEPADTTGCTQLGNGNWTCRDVILGPYVGIGIAL